MYENEIVRQLLKTNEYLQTIVEKMAPPKERVVPFDPNKYYDASDLARLFNVSKRTIYKWGQDGRLPRLKMGSKLLYPRREIEELVRKLETVGSDWYAEEPVE